MMQLTLSGNGRASILRLLLIHIHSWNWWVGMLGNSNHRKSQRLLSVHTPEELPQADIHLLCLADDALETIIARIHQKGVIAHTSGAVGLEVFNTDQQGGVFYPLKLF